MTDPTPAPTPDDPSSEGGDQSGPSRENCVPVEPMSGVEFVLRILPPSVEVLGISIELIQAARRMGVGALTGVKPIQTIDEAQAAMASLVAAIQTITETVKERRYRNPVR